MSLKTPNKLVRTGAGLLAVSGVLWGSPSFAQSGPPGSPAAGIPASKSKASPPPSGPAPAAPTRAGAKPPSQNPPSQNTSTQVSPGAASENAAPQNLEGRIGELLVANPDLPCEYSGHWKGGSRVWVACGTHGLLVLNDADGELRAIETRDMGGRVLGFFSRNGSVWARISREHAVAIAGSDEQQELPGPPQRPLPGLAPPPPDLTAPSAVPPAPKAEPAQAEPAQKVVLVGTVVKVVDRDVFVSIGASEGLTLRDKVAIYDGDSLVVGGEQDMNRRRVVVGPVVELWRDRARIRIGVNEYVQVGAQARLTREPATKSRVAPPRVPGVWELRALARPMFSLGSVGGGVLAELSLGRRTENWHYGAALNPVGIGADDADGATFPWSGYVFGAFDSKAFSAGLGFGGQSVNNTDVETGSGLSIVQLLRLGAVDGLHLAARSSVVIFRSTTNFASLEMQGQLAVGDASWLLLRGGGGNVGYGFGEVALRSLMYGNGGADSFFLEVGVGGSVLIDHGCPELEPFVGDDFECHDQTIGGPMVGIGGEWRL